MTFTAQLFSLLQHTVLYCAPAAALQLLQNMLCLNLNCTPTDKREEKS